MLLRLLINLFFIYALWQLIKFVFRIALQYWIRKNAGKAFHYQGNFRGGFRQDENRPVGDIRVESKGNGGGNKNNRPSEDGEYVDFEEVS